jgi:hypothetical protein
MNTQDTPLAPQSLDPVEAAIQAAGLSETATPALPSVEPVEANVEEAQAKEPEQRRARQFAEAAEAKRRAAQSEARARQAAKEAREQQAAWTKEKADVEALFTGVKGNKAALDRLLQKTGLTLDDIARTALELDIEKPTAESKADQALEEARALRKQLEEEKAAIEYERKIEHSKKAYDHYVKAVTEELTKDTSDKYELVKEKAAFPQVLDRCLKFLQENGISQVSDEEMPILVSHCAGELEQEFFSQAESEAALFNKSGKLKKLLGNLSHTSNGSSDPLRDNVTASSLIEELAQEQTLAARRGNKFITNDATVGSSPATVTSKRQTDIDREIDALVKAAAGKKPF